MSALDRLKNIQSNFKRTWNGINCEYSGRSGTSNFVNKKRVFHIPETYFEEEDRQRQLLKVFIKLKDFEEDKSVNGGAGSTSNGTTSNSIQSFNKTSSNSQGGFFTSNNTGGTSGL
jgi:hypothetical protein